MMEKPMIINFFESQIRHDISLAANKNENLDYYSYFIDFLEEQKKITLVKGNVVGLQYKSPKQIGGGGITNQPFGIEHIEYGIKYLKFIQKKETGKTAIEQGTARQTSLTFFYMSKAKAFPRKTGTILKDAGFVKFLTGQDLKTIRDTLGNPLNRKKDKTGKGTQSLIKDLTIVLSQFKQIQFMDGVELIENDIETLQNDLNSFK